MSISGKDKSRIIKVQSPRNEFQVFLMLLSALSGISIFFDKASDPQLFTLPTWIYTSWGLVLVLSSFANLFAAFYPWRSTLSGLYVEIASLVGLTVGPIIYSLALLGYLDNLSLTRFLAIDLLAFGASVRLVRLVIAVFLIKSFNTEETISVLEARDLYEEEDT